MIKHLLIYTGLWFRPLKNKWCVSPDPFKTIGFLLFGLADYLTFKKAAATAGYAHIEILVTVLLVNFFDFLVITRQHADL